MYVVMLYCAHLTLLYNHFLQHIFGYMYILCISIDFERTINLYAMCLKRVLFVCIYFSVATSYLCNYYNNEEITNTKLSLYCTLIYF